LPDRQYSTAEAVEAPGALRRAGADVLLAGDALLQQTISGGIVQHFKTIAESTKLPCILYNVPSRTVVSLASETVIRLSQIGNIIGVKEASGNLEEIGKIIGVARKGFLVWSGNDSDTLPVMAIGGYGVISVASHLVGLQIKEMMNKYLAGKTGEAACLHIGLLPLMKVLFVVSNPVPVKYALNKVGFRVGKPAASLNRMKLRADYEILKNYKIDLPLDCFSF
jgi:4-hydroxy-tetrahydrodipicolinate synthase